MEKKSQELIEAEQKEEKAWEEFEKIKQEFNRKKQEFWEAKEHKLNVLMGRENNERR